MAFLDGWAGTITCDDHKGYDALFREGRIEAGCLAHARRKFDELAKANASPVAMQGIQRIAGLYRIEQEARAMTAPDRLQSRQLRAKPLWDELQVWIKLKRTRVADGSGIAAALDNSLNRLDGARPLPARRRGQHRRQPRRAIDATVGDGQEGPALLRQRIGWATRCGGDEPSAVGQAQWARSVGLPQGCAGAVARASEPPDR